MRPGQMLRRARPVQLGVGAAMLAIPASAVALTATQADAQSAIPITLSPHQVRFGRAVTVTGSVPATSAGETLELQFASAPGAGWRSVAATRARASGHFMFVSSIARSGYVRVVPAGPLTGPVTAVPSATSASADSPSSSQHVSVAASFAVRTWARAARSGQDIHVRGRLLPAAAGRRVQLITRRGRNWRTLASARTGPRGGFDLRYRPGATGTQWLRVRFPGDRANTSAWGQAGHVTAFRPSVASWYSDGGATACGFHAQFGVANVSLPCGTKVTFQYGGRTVTAVVDDRGPYVGGREWDLNQNTAAALGFGGVGTVWSSI